MLTQHIALVPEVAGVNPSELARVSAALQKQVVNDLSPIWGITATVDAFPHLEDVPVGYWPIILAFGELGADEGIHIDNRGQPYALIEMSPSWSLAASHVCLEMLVDPFGNRTVTGASPRSDQGAVEFLLEICHPCEDARHGYTVNDVLVSDFCTPEYLAQVGSGKERYSFTGAIQAPYQVLPGGRLTWYDPATNKWWQRNHYGGSARDTDIGTVDRRAARVRGIVNPRAPKHLQATKMPLEVYEARMGIPRQRGLRASQAQAHLLRVQLGNPAENGLRLEGQRAPVVDAVRMRSGLPDRPQVLTALLRASVGPTKDPDLASLLERAMAAGILAPESQQQSSKNEIPPPSDLPVQGVVAERREDREPESDPDLAHLYISRAEEAAVARRHAAQARRVQQSPRMPSAKAPQTEPTLRRTIPPPLPRMSPVPRPSSSPHSNLNERGSTGRTLPSSLAPTSGPVVETHARPTGSMRDRILLVAAVGAAGLAAVAIYGSASPSGAAVSVAAPAASGAPVPPPPQAASAAPATTAAENAAPPRTGTDPASLPAAPPASRAAAAPNPGTPRPARPKAAGTAAKSAQTAPPADQATGDSLDFLVDERR